MTWLETEGGAVNLTHTIKLWVGQDGESVRIYGRDINQQAFVLAAEYPDQASAEKALRAIVRRENEQQDTQGEGA